jgi:hypothetical protein
MKNLIKKILREETSGLTDEQIKLGYVMMNNLTKGYHWYHDTPEQRFVFTSSSIWLLNPDTEEWMLELQKSGDLWYYNEIFDSFSRYLSMERSDFESFITIWVEDVLERGVVSIIRNQINWDEEVKDVLEKGIITTYRHDYMVLDRVKDAVEKGTVTTVKLGEWSQVGVGDVIKNGNTIKNQEI